ncbi:MAG: S8 family serine peptidase [Ignavibacteria bacterium]|nr:S8 family serine peptidase [Ignavibacteria bacterium]
MMIDTCSGSATYNHKYAKRMFRIQFPIYFYPFDHVLDSGEVKGVSDIDSAYLGLKNRFLEIQDTFGIIYFQGLNHFYSDSIVLLNPVLQVFFEEYQDIDFIVQHFTSTIDSIVKFVYSNRAGNPCILPNDKGMKANNTIADIYLGSPNYFYPRNWRPNGFQSYMYNIFCPMAWELTYGSSNVCVAIDDIWVDEIIHPDISNNHVFNTDLGNGITNTGALRTDHGLWVTSCAVAQNDNGYPLVGSSPRCKTISTNGANLEIDIDGVVNGYLKFADIRNMSYGSSAIQSLSDWSGDRLDRTDMDAGVVCVSGTANSRSCLNGGCDEYSIVRPNGIREYFPATVFPGASAYTDPDDPTDPYMDYRIICVGAAVDGVLKDQDCNPWPSSWLGPNFSDEFQFLERFNFGPGIDKFNTNSDATIRLHEKERAMTDIIAPARVTFADGGSTLSNLRKYNVDGSGTSFSAPIVSGIIGLMLSSNKFIGVTLQTNGNPVNGRDVQRKVYDILTFTAKKIVDFQNFNTDVFTVDGIQGFYSTTNDVGQPIQYDYRTQWNDKLKRSWAQRVGFGLVDAYRSIAHSIRQKGLQEYNLSGSITLTFDADDGSGTFTDQREKRGYTMPSSTGTPYGGRMAMHWGSQVEEGTGLFEMPVFRGSSPGNDGVLNVLDWGGVSLPGEFHNNQGVTKITSTNDAQNYIEVPEDCILAIDGILFSDQPEYCHYVRTDGTTEANSSIIEMEGYIKDVELYGNLRIGDVILDGTTDEGSADESGCIGFGTSGNEDDNYLSEIYGKVDVINLGFIYSNGNIKMQPGSSVNLNGDKDFRLKGGWAAEDVFRNDTMEHNTKISSTTGRAVTVEDGVTLWIDLDAVVTFDCELNVKNHGTVVLRRGSVAKVKYLNIEPGGTIIIDTSATLALKDAKQICDGNFLIHATNWGKAIIVGNLSPTCLPTDSKTPFPLYSDYQFVETQPVIFMKGDCSIETECWNPEDEEPAFPTQSLKLKNAIFKDISINGSNIYICEPIDSCEFIVKTDITNPSFKFDYLLSFYDNCQTCEQDKFKSLWIKNSIFKDLTQPLPPPNNSDINKLIYRTGGVIVEGYDIAEIENTRFGNLEFGVNTFDCEQTFIHNSRFDSCGIGDYDFASTTLLCQDTFNLVKFGSVRDRSLTGRVFNNEYNKSRIAFSAISSQEQRLRNNIFDEYVVGISSDCSPIRIGDVVEGGVGIIYGRNWFKHETVSGYPHSYNNYLSKECERTLYSADISINNECCSLFMACGHNHMSEHSYYHIRYRGSGGFSVDGSHNYFPPNSISNCN